MQYPKYWNETTVHAVAKCLCPEGYLLCRQLRTSFESMGSLRSPNSARTSFWISTLPVCLHHAGSPWGIIIMLKIKIVITIRHEIIRNESYTGNQIATQASVGVNLFSFRQDCKGCWWHFRLLCLWGGAWARGTNKVHSECQAREGGCRGERPAVLTITRGGHWNMYTTSHWLFQIIQWHLN